MIKSDLQLLYFISSMFFSVINTTKIYPIVSDLEPLLKTQESIMNDLEKYIVEKRDTLDFIESEIERYETEHNKAMNDAEQYLGNPINSLRLIKRLTIDLEFIENTTRDDSALKRHSSLKYPSHEDLEEAVGMITRLQHVYQLNTTQLADGKLNTSFGEGKQNFSESFLPMTSSDCFEISKLLGNEKKLKSQKLRLSWLFEALRTHSKRELDCDFNKFDIVLEICEIYDVLDDSGNYLKWIQKLLDMKPSYNNRLLQAKIKRHETQLREKPKEITKEKIRRKTIIDPKKEVFSCFNGLGSKAYRMHCRGEVDVPREISKELKCWYFTGHHPFTKLAPFKAEQLYIKPNVFLFHDVLSDNEINTIKQLALPELGVSESMSYRLSKGMQIKENQTSGLEQVGQRISDLTGLEASITMTSISHYGVGGHYTTHVDSMNKLTIDENDAKWREVFNELGEDSINDILEISKQVYRIATVIFYLSDVEQGGATVFPVLGLTVFPVKGAALFWTNMLPSLTVDYTTCHGACPVLRGSKWVASKWIDAENQELKKPCTVEITSRKPDAIPFPEIKE